MTRVWSRVLSVELSKILMSKSPDRVWMTQSGKPPYLSLKISFPLYIRSI